MSSKVVGIIGGMGPEATVDLYIKMLKATPATKDQDHLHVIIDSNCKIPDRTMAIVEKGESPLPELIKTMKNLENAGAELLVMPCNTAHYYYPAMKKETEVEFLHIMEETAKFLAGQNPKLQKVGLLATTGTYDSGLYNKACADRGIELLIPQTAEREEILAAIREVKGGSYEEPRAIMRKAALALIERGAEAIILGCTEIPLAFYPEDCPVLYADATDILAQAAVKKALQ